MEKDGQLLSRLDPQVVELERRLAQAESESQRLADKGKLQRTETDWMLQKEKQMKQARNKDEAAEEKEEEKAAAAAAEKEEAGGKK